MSEQLRFQATAVIWTALAAIIIFAPGDKVALAFLLGVAATGSTIAIWESLKDVAKLQQPQQQAGKTKRTNKINRIVEELDDEEVADMEEFLAARRDDRLQDRER